MYSIYRYPHLLTANLINKVSNLEESGTSATSPATRTYIAELRAEFHSRSRERLEKLTSGVNPANFAAANQSSHGTGITIVKVGGTQGTNGVGGSGSSRSELNALSGVGQREIHTRSGSSTAAGVGGGAGSRSELNAPHHRLSAVAMPTTNQQKTSLFLNGSQRPPEVSVSSYQPSSLLVTGSTMGQRNFEVLEDLNFLRRLNF